MLEGSKKFLWVVFANDIGHSLNHYDHRLATDETGPLYWVD